MKTPENEMTDLELLQQAFDALDKLITRWESNGLMTNFLNDPKFSPVVSARDHILSAKVTIQIRSLRSL